MHTRMTILKYRFLLTGCIFILFLSLGFSEKDQDIPQTLTLDQAVDYAIKNNTDIKTQEQVMQVIKAQYIQARSNILPQFNLTVEGDKFINAFASTSSGRDGSDIFSTISLTQPVYTFGRLGSAINYERLAIQNQEVQLVDTKQSITLSVTSAFYNVLLEDELVNVSKEALRTTEDHLKEAQLRFDQGVNTKFDVTRAQVAVANQKPNLISARNNLVKARQSLNQLFNLPPNTEIKLTGKLEFVDYTLDSGKAWQIAIENRTDLKSQKLIVQQNETLLRLNRARYFPTLTAGGDYTFQSNMYEGNPQNNFQTWSANITLTMPIFDGFNISGQIKEAKANLEQAKLAYEKTLLFAQTQVEQTILEIKKQKELVDAAKEAIDLAQLSLSMAQLSYENGKATTLDVTDAELSLTTARSNWAQAIHDYLVALASLKKTLGVNELTS